MTTKLAPILVIVVALHAAVAAQTPATDSAARIGSLRQIIPGHYVYTTNNEGRLFNSGVVATNDGVLVFDALDTDAIARAERQAIANVIKQPIRYLVSSPFHDPFNGGSAVYADVFKIAHDNYRAGLIDQMQRGNVAERRAAGADAERDLSRSHDVVSRWQGDPGPPFRQCAHQGGQRGLHSTGPGRLHERGVLQRRIPEHGRRLRCLVDSSARCGEGAGR